MYRIWCRVWGGVTGSREDWLKHDGRVREFVDKDEALELARRLNDERNGPWAVAFFDYEVREHAQEQAVQGR